MARTHTLDVEFAKQRRRKTLQVERKPSIVWIQAFVLFQLACQISLLFEQVGALRVVARSSAFGISLLLLGLIPGEARYHPAVRFAGLIVVIVGIGLLHPYTSGPVAGMAQIGLYLAILAPLFWVARIQVDLAGFRRVVLLLWVFHALSCGVGVLQIYYPGRFQPALSTAIAGQGMAYVSGLTIELASGTRVFRPMGLTDVPGGASMSGMYAVLLGTGLLLSERGGTMRILSLASMLTGVFCLNLCQVRSMLVMTGICLVCLFAVLAWKGDFGRLVGSAVASTVVIVAGFAWSIAIGGASVTSRLSTLAAASPKEVYAANRGHFMAYTWYYLLPENPLGAGLGRYGMISYYFSDQVRYDLEPLWAEIQWTAWVIDGGLPLVLAYSAALFSACVVVWRIGIRHRMDMLGGWAAVILAYNIGAVALTFCSTAFAGQGGMEFWLLNATFFAAATHVTRQMPNRTSGI